MFSDVDQYHLLSIEFDFFVAVNLPELRTLINVQKQNGFVLSVEKPRNTIFFFYGFSPDQIRFIFANSRNFSFCPDSMTAYICDIFGVVNPWYWVASCFWRRHRYFPYFPYNFFYDVCYQLNSPLECFSLFFVETFSEALPAFLEYTRDGFTVQELSSNKSYLDIFLQNRVSISKEKFVEEFGSFLYTFSSSRQRMEISKKISF